ncbi:MAG: hypothetical protein N4A44_02255 [Alphaproteobacteria bacterium]|jgi:hypothetical protein|nr:hypothetical protein [Alphaproteobacteria bacterium]
MEREKSTLAIFALLVVLAWILSTSFLVFSALFFVLTLVLTFYISHKYIGSPDYNEVMREVSLEYKQKIKENRVIIFFKDLRKFASHIMSKKGSK